MFADNEVSTHCIVNSSNGTRSLSVNYLKGCHTPIVWLHGYRSDKEGKKAQAIKQWAIEHQHPFLRFDYSGHGQSTGDLRTLTLTDWIHDSYSVIQTYTQSPPIVIGSSMGAWIAACLAIGGAFPPLAVQHLILIAPAFDFLSRLIWDKLDSQQKEQCIREGEYVDVQPEYAYQIPYALIKDSLLHNVQDQLHKIPVPIDILQGMSDQQIPYDYTWNTICKTSHPRINALFIKNGDHSLSRKEDLSFLINVLSRACAKG